MDVMAAPRGASADSIAGLLDGRDKSKWIDVGRKPFVFRHRLAGHPLFERARLARLAQQMLDRDDVRRCFASNLQCERSQMKQRIGDAILHMEEADSWIKLSHAHQVSPDYDVLLQSLLVDLESMLELPLRELATWSGMTIFMNSPHYVVPYHFDHESNFLLQIVGEKEVRLYPPDERVLSLGEIEAFYHGDAMAGRYRDEVESFVSKHVITPGTAVHHPPLAPHRVLNNKETSISLSVYFSLPANDAKARVRQFNWYLRRLGLEPSPLGQSPLADAAKRALIQAFVKSRPQTWDEYMFSGVRRIDQPIQFAKRVGRTVASFARLRRPLQ